MYDDIADIYLEIFPLNQAFLTFLQEYLANPGSAVLDLGCGPGDYVDTLTRSGYRAVGIDSSEVMIAEAQAQKQGIYYNLSFTEISQLEGDFDCACCVGNSLSYLPEDATQPFLKDIHRLLHPSGVFILQVVNWDKFFQMGAADFPVKTISGGRTFHRRYEWVEPSKVIFHTEIQKDGETLMSWADPLYPKYFESVIGDLQTAGLTVSGKYGDYNKSTFDPKSSPAMILVAHK